MIKKLMIWALAAIGLFGALPLVSLLSSKVKLALTSVILAANLVTPVLAGAFDDAVAAYDQQYYVTAMQLWRPLADAGDALAQVSLGVMYRNGEGVPRGNEVTAYMWFSLSAAQGNKKAAEYRDSLAKRMTAAQIAEARKRASEWKPKQ